MGVRTLIERFADFITPISATPTLDVAANRRHLRSGDLHRIRTGLRQLGEVGHRWGCAREARGDVEALLSHDDPGIAAMASEVLARLPE